MRSIGELKSEVVDDTVPRFVMKLWSMVNDPETNSVIGWTTDGTEFYITNHTVFYQELLPAFYKHNNMSSFIRQLNLYGFKKVKLLHSDSLRYEQDTVLFHHVSFVRDHPELLSGIHRKIRHVRYDLVSEQQLQQEQQQMRPRSVLTESATSSVAVRQLINDVKNVCTKVESVESHLGAVRRENESLWREVLLLRQRHAKQQQVLNKLIQFLVTMVHPTGRTASNISVKRKQLPMLDEAGGGNVAGTASLGLSGVNTMSVSGADSSGTLTSLARMKAATNCDTSDSSVAASGVDLLDELLGGGQMSPEGPIIRDVTDMVSPSGAVVVGDVHSPARAVSGVSDVGVAAPNEYGDVVHGGLHLQQQQQYHSESSIPNIGVAGDQVSSEEVGSLPEVLASGGTAGVSVLPESIPNTTLALSRTDTIPAADRSSDPSSASTLRYDSLLDEIQADLDGLRDLFGNVCSPAPVPSSAGPSSWQESLLSDYASQSTSGDAEAPSVSTENNQLLPYSPSLSDLFSSASDLFPDLRDVRPDNQPGSEQSAVSSELSVSSPVPVTVTTASVVPLPPTHSMNSTEEFRVSSADSLVASSNNWQQSPMLQTPQRVVDNEIIEDVADQIMTDASLSLPAPVRTTTSITQAPSPSVSLLSRPAAPLGSRTVSVAQRPLPRTVSISRSPTAARHRSFKPAAVSRGVSSRRVLPVVRVARAADGSTRAVSAVTATRRAHTG